MQDCGFNFRLNISAPTALTRMVPLIIGLPKGFQNLKPINFLGYSENRKLWNHPHKLQKQIRRVRWTRLICFFLLKAKRLGPHFPRGQIMFLFGGQSINLDAQRLQFQTGNLLICFLGNRVNLTVQDFVVFHDIFCA